MENKINHIDDFLFQKLQDFEETPNAGTFNTLYNDFTHLDGADLTSLNQHLTQYEESPNPDTSKLIFEVVQHLNHPIDFSLHQNLRQFEQNPDKIVPIFQEEKKQRKKVFLFFILVSIIGSCAVIINQFQNKIEQSNKVSFKPDITEKKQIELPKEFQNKKLSIIKENKKELASVPFILNNQKVKYELNKVENLPETTINDFSNDFELIFDSIKNHKVFKLKITYDKLPLEPIKKYNIVTFKDLSNLVENNNLSIGLLNNQHKVFYEFGIGLNNINYNKHQLNTDYIHKDALNLLKQTIGNFESGQSLRANIGYNLNNKIQIISGFNFDFQSYSNQVNYVYTDIPIYDLNNGKVLSYLVRPASSSPTINQKIRTKSNEIKIPFSISFYTFRMHKTTIWTSLGAVYNLKNTINSQYFNFKDGSLTPYTNNVKTTNNMSPFVQIRSITPLNQSLKLVIQFGVNKSQNKMTIYNQNYSYNQLTPNINLGLHFNLKFNQVK